MNQREKMTVPVPAVRRGDLLSMAGHSIEVTDVERSEGGAKVIITATIGLDPVKVILPATRSVAVFRLDPNAPLIEAAFKAINDGNTNNNEYWRAVAKQAVEAALRVQGGEK